MESVLVSVAEQKVGIIAEVAPQNYTVRVGILKPNIVPMRVISSEDGFQMTVSSDSVEVGTKAAAEIRVTASDVYPGPYTVTPTEETQILSTQNKLDISNITIEPIPANYGRLTWNGNILTVS